MSRDRPRPADKLGRMLQRFSMGPRVSREELGVVIDGDNANSTRR